VLLNIVLRTRRIQSGCRGGPVRLEEGVARYEGFSVGFPRLSSPVEDQGPERLTRPVTTGGPVPASMFLVHVQISLRSERSIRPGPGR